MNKTLKNMRVLVTGGRAPATLHLIRLLKDNENYVILAESYKLALSRTSNCISKFYYVSQPRFKTKKYIEELIDIIIREQVDILIPTCEEVFYISKHIERLKKYCHVFTMEIETLNKLHNKYLFSKYLEGLDIEGIRVPRTKSFSSVVKIEDYFKRNIESTGLVCKPEYSRFGNDTLIFKRSAEFKKNINASEVNRYIVQDYIEGKEVCIFAICLNGKILAYSAYDTVITASGANILFRYYENNYVYQRVDKLIKNLNFTGMISFDSILDENNELYFIECNPRLTSGIHLFTDDDDIFSNRGRCEVVFPSPQTCTSLKLAILSTLLKRPVRKIKALFSSKDAIFSNKDIVPYFFQLISFTHMLYKSIKHKKSIIDITTEDIEFNMENL
ncbi:ATP-grasp domain-containing protein [Wukongibacter baidiensis]|uniref:ATP-grasp domain-containing protein n=1 Tax=Wukongibacter baidiensis TaxID=1723361 RepID=UPI003D7FA68D